MGSIDMPQIRFRRGTWGTRRRRTFAGLAGMLGLGLGLVAGCVLYVDEDAIGACSDVSCGANAFCDVGDCYCFTGYGGDPDGNCDPEQRWLVRDACDDATDVEFRLFSTSRDWVWPSEGVYATAGLEVDRVPTEDWAQIFNEVWRRFRDFFYVGWLAGGFQLSCHPQNLLI